MRNKIIICILLIAILGASSNYQQLSGSVKELIFGTSSSQNSMSPQAKMKLWITADYGAHTVWVGEVKIAPGQNLLTLMKKHLQVGTGYGGGFVKTINSYPAHSSIAESRDWFLYIDGILSDKGAGEVVPASGQVIWWDFHSWDGTTFVPAAIGAYPAPLCGDLMTAVPGNKDYLETLRELSRTIQHKSEVSRSSIALSDKWTPELYSFPVIIVGEWPQLCKTPAIAALFDRSTEGGIFCDFKDGALQAYDEQGRLVRTFGAGSGCIVSTGSGLGDTSPVWIISGTDRQGVNRVIELLRVHPEQLARKFGLVVSGSEVMALPARAE
ncbi:MAG: DUF4430 domain-containing protein [Candidatus Saccharibacteria bacterium]